MSLKNFGAQYQHQGGFLIPLALFIVVVLGVLAVTISKMASSAQNIALREAIATQTLFAAQSGANLALYNLFLSATTRAQTTANCTAIHGSSRSFTAVGLNNCTVTWSCSVTTDAGNLKSFYRITTAASCGSGNLSSQRTLVVAATME